VFALIWLARLIDPVARVSTVQERAQGTRTAVCVAVQYGRAGGRVGTVRVGGARTARGGRAERAVGAQSEERGDAGNTLGRVREQNAHGARLTRRANL
jgi:hypothetical protein